MLSSELRNLVAETTETALTRNDDDRHTVAGGILTESGRIVTAMNSYHFSGGPCGEIAALARHATECPDDPIAAVAAVHGPTGEVVPPCGKCRQVMHDLNPGIRFVVRDESGLVPHTAAELLPHAFSSMDLGREQLIHMWDGYEELIRAGRKTQTIRVDDPFKRGPATVVFDREDGSQTRTPVTVTNVRSTEVGRLNDDDAVADGFADLAELRAALTRHYPGLGDDAPVDVVTFRLDEPTPGAGGRR